MALKTLTIDPLTDARWQDLVQASDQSSIFHHIEWLRLIRAQYRYRMLATCVVDSDGELVAGVPFAHVKSRLTGNRFAALPFSDLCPAVLADPDRHDALEMLASSLHQLHRDTGVDVELRGSLDGIPETGKTFYHHEIPLEGGLDAVRAGFSTNTRRQVKRAAREELAVRRGTSVEDLDAFFELHLQTRRRQGVPTQPRRFIRRLERVFDAGLGFVVVVSCGQEPAAAGVYLHWGGTLTYKYGASAERHLSKRPNHAMFMEAIRWGCENRIATLDLGRTDLEPEGLRTFKLGWGAQERMLTYSALRKRADKSSTAGLPAFASTVITRTPPMTGRLAGLVFYRHAG